MAKNIKKSAHHFIRNYDLAKENFVNYRVDRYGESFEEATTIWHHACFIVLSKHINEVLVTQQN
jgi:hypothetical protein